MRILRITKQLLNRFDNPNERYDIINHAIRNAERSLYPAVNEISNLDNEYENYKFGSSSASQMSKTVLQDHLNELKEYICDKINMWAITGKLAENKHLGRILFLWEKWEGHNTVKNYVDNLIKTDDGLINFVTGGLNRSWSWNSNDNETKVNFDIDMKYINKFAEPYEIKSKLRLIASRSEFDQLNSKKKLAVEKFLEKMDKIQSDLLENKNTSIVD